MRVYKYFNLFTGGSYFHYLCHDTRKRISSFLQFTNKTVLGAFAKLRKATINFFRYVCLSVRPHGTSAPTVWIFTKFVK
jgi:hypothetical protein